jgi:hypothetical protein
MTDACLAESCGSVPFNRQQQQRQSLKNVVVVVARSLSLSLSLSTTGRLSKLKHRPLPKDIHHPQRHLRIFKFGAARSKILRASVPYE